MQRVGVKPCVCVDCFVPITVFTPLIQSKGSCKSSIRYKSAKSQTLISLWWFQFSIIGCKRSPLPAIMLLSVVDRGRSQARSLGLQPSELLTLARDRRIPSVKKVFLVVFTFCFLVLPQPGTGHCRPELRPWCVCRIQLNSFLNINKITYLKRIWSIENHF